MPETRTICTPDDARALSNWLVGLPMPFTLTVKDGKPRSLNQNALLHKWFGEIADHHGDLSASEAKGICHREFGLSIRTRDQQFAWIWERTGAKLDYEKQCAMLASGVLNVSSGMTTIELKEYLDAMQPHFIAKGVPLSIPEERR